MEEVFIYYHPATKKHLGLGRAVFEHRKAAKECVEKMNGRSLMGLVLEAFVDPFGAKCKSMYEELTSERPKQESVKKEEKPPAKEVETKLVPSATPVQATSDSYTRNSQQSSGSSSFCHSTRTTYVCFQFCLRMVLNE